MALFLTIMEGDRPGNAEPILATRDPKIISLVARELNRRLQPAKHQDSSRLTQTDTPGQANER